MRAGRTRGLGGLEVWHLLRVWLTQFCPPRCSKIGAGVRVDLRHRGQAPGAPPSQRPGAQQAAAVVRASGRRPARTIGERAGLGRVETVGRRHGRVRAVEAGQSRRAKPRRAKARQGVSRRGEAWHGMATTGSRPLMRPAPLFIAPPLSIVPLGRGLRADRGADPSRSLGWLRSAGYAADPHPDGGAGVWRAGRLHGAGTVAALAYAWCARLVTDVGRSRATARPYGLDSIEADPPPDARVRSGPRSRERAAIGDVPAR